MSISRSDTGKVINAVLKFKGIDNLHDPVRMPEGYVVEAVNGYITDQEGFTRRNGRTRVSSLVGAHSLWAHESFCFYVKDSILYRLFEDYSSAALLTLSTNDKTIFCGLNGVYVFSNGTDVGTIDNGVASMAVAPATTRNVEGVAVATFKEKLPAADLMCLWNGMLLLAKHEYGETWVYHTQGFDFSGVDSRHAYFRYEGAPTLLLAVNDGVYVGAGESVWWLTSQGANKWSTIQVCNKPAIKGCGFVTNGNTLNLEGVDGPCVVFATDKVNIGMNSGRVLNISKNSVVLPKASEGLAFFEEINGVKLGTFVLSSESITTKQYQKQKFGLFSGNVYLP